MKENGQPQTKIAILLMLKLRGTAPYFALLAVVVNPAAGWEYPCSHVKF